MLTTDAFLRSLAETIAWCAPRALIIDDDGRLRSADLRPPQFDAIDADRPWDYIIEPTTPWPEIVRGVVERRAQRLLAEPHHDLNGVTVSVGGRLVLFDPRSTLFDGAAEVGSDGFFDVSNVPPWDTWVAWVQDEEREARHREEGIAAAGGPGGWTDFAACVVSWVPPELEDLVGYGIEVNPESCIAWASDVETALTQQLRGLGLI